METEGTGERAAAVAPAAAAAAEPPPPPPPPGALEFGWVPAEVVHALVEEVGNFRARAAAIELLHAAVLEAGREPAALLPTLSSFLAFLLRLVGDANFKIAISAMIILEDLVGAMGADAAPYLGTLAIPLIERLGDNVQMVRLAAGRAVGALARALGPAPVLAALGGALVHPSWRAREEGANAYSAALLAHPKERLDYPACVRALAAAAGDEHPRVAAAALEAFVLLHARLGALLAGLMTAVGAPEEVKRAVAERAAATPQLGLPALDAQGNLVHQPHARPPSAQQRARPAAAVAMPVYAAQAAHAAALPYAAAGGHGYGGYADVAASVEVSSPSCASSSGSFFAGGGEQEVERSEGSLLNWQRPMRRPNQQSISGPAGGYAAAAQAGRADGAEQQGQQQAQQHHHRQQQQQQQQASRAGSLRSLARPGKPADADLGRRGSTPAAATPAPQPTVVRRSLAPQALAGVQPAAAPMLGALSSAGLNSDLSSSVRNWQRQRQGSGVADGGQPGDTDSLASTSSWGAAPAEQEAGLAVEPRSDSLLQWRLPQRPNAKPSASSPAAVAAAAATAAPTLDAAAAAAASPPPRIGSASFRRALTSFKNKLGFGGELGSEAAADDGVLQKLASLQLQPGLCPAAEEQQPASPGWSIAAVRQAPEAAAGQLGTGLSVVVADPAGTLPGSSEQPQAESPGKGSDRLSRLKQMTERRRVWSAPTNALRAQVQQLDLDADAASATLPLPSSPGPVAVELAPTVEAASGEVSPGVRPGLQALKARARTARILSSGSLGAGGLGPPPLTAGGALGGGSLYSMEAMEAVFGPDQPVGGATVPADSLWSPIKTSGGNVASTGSSSGGVSSVSPPRLSVPLRSVASGSLQWPDSPSGGAGTPTGRSASSWRNSSFPDSPTATSSPKAGAGALGDTASGAFQPASDTAPLAQPEAALVGALAALQAAALSQKKELDWQAQFEGLRNVRRLALHHAGLLIVPLTLHALVALVAPVVDALRSTLSRLAIAVFQSLAEALGPALDAELDAFVPLLLKRAGQISVSGRDNFLAVEADRALSAVVERCGDVRPAISLLNCLSSKSPDVRAKAAMHLDACLQLHGPRLVGGLGGTGGGGGSLLPRLLHAAVALLEEGGLEGRTAGKRMLWELRRLMDGEGFRGEEFKRAVARLNCKSDKVWDVFESGRMPAAPARLPSAGLRPASGGPPSPTAASFSPAKPAGLSATGSTLGQVSRAGSVNLSASALNSSGSAAGGGTDARPVSGLVYASAAAVAGALPPSKWAPGARPGRHGGARGGTAGAPPGTAGVGRQASRPGSAGTPSGPVPSGSLSGLDPDLQQRLEGASHQLGSTEWKARLEGLEVLAAAAGGAAAAALPQGVQLWLADALAPRVVDANLKVQQQALMVLNGVLDSVGSGLAPAAPALAPAICKCLDSGNPSVRQAATQALDAALRSWSADVHVLHLMAAAGNPSGGIRSKAVVLDRLAAFGPPLWRSRPALIRQHVLPALFSLLAAGKRPELRQLAQGALSQLAGSMGGELVKAAAASPLLGPPQQQLVAECVAAAGAAPR